MKFVVKAQAFDRKTGQVCGKSRNETVDTRSNELFNGCRTVLEVKRVYEGFWNEMNPKSVEVVFVQRVTRRAE